ncbi:MAG TPA: type II secretion system protein GspM [Roseomonas sp.]
MMTLSPTARRAAALALLLVPPILVWLVIVAPWLATRADLSDRIEDALAIEARARAVAAREATLTAEGEALRRALAGAAELSSAGSHALAGAELQRRVRDAAGRHRGSVQSLETLPEERAGGGMVGIRARLQTSPEGLQALLSELEAGRALIQVQSLTLATSGVGTRRPLDVQFQLRALRREETRP